MPPTTTTTKASPSTAQIEAEARRLAGELERAAKAGEAGAEREHRGEQQRLVHPERGDHLAILRRRPHQPPEAGAHQQQMQRR